jgi:methyl-accepting chemotaxis protein
MKRSVLRRLKWSMMSFGVVMGIIFPFYAAIFVNFKEGLLLYFIAGALMAGITVGVANHFMVKIILLPHIRKIKHLTAALTTSLDISDISVESYDEIGDIINSLSKDASAVQGLISQVTEQSSATSEIIRSLNSFVHELNSVTKESTDSSRILSNSLKQVNSNSASNYNQLENIAKSSATMDDSFESLKKSFKKINSSCASENSMVTGVTEDAENVSLIMNEFKSSADGINSIASDIHSITKETAILSVNAAVEAANAGVHGKGFSIVAREMRELANRSEKGARKIELIATVMNERVANLSSKLNLELETLKNIKNVSQDILETVVQESDSIDAADKLSKGVNISVESVKNISKESNQEIDIISKNIEKLSSKLEANSLNVSNALNDITKLSELSKQMENHLSKFE